MEPQSLHLYELIKDTISSSNNINISKEDIDYLSAKLLVNISPYITELKVRVRRAEKATYLASKDEIEANYNIKTMSEDDLSDEIEKHMFHLYCRADDEILKEIQGEQKCLVVISQEKESS